MPITLFYTIADADGDKSRVEFQVDPTNVTILNAPTLMVDVWNLMNPLINGQLISAGFTVEADISAYTNVIPGALADVQEKAEFVFRTAGGFLKRINLPTFVETLFGSSGASSEVNLADTNVAAFVTAIVDGITVGGDDILFQDTRGDEIASLSVARENWGKRRL